MALQRRHRMFLEMKVLCSTTAPVHPRDLYLLKTALMVRVSSPLIIQSYSKYSSFETVHITQILKSQSLVEIIMLHVFQMNLTALEPLLVSWQKITVQGCQGTLGAMA